MIYGRLGVQNRMSKRRHPNGQQVYERCSVLLIIKEMQIKTTMRYHLRPVRMALITTETENKNCQ